MFALVSGCYSLHFLDMTLYDFNMFKLDRNPGARTMSKSVFHPGGGFLWELDYVYTSANGTIFN